MANLLMFDSIDASSLPAGYSAYAGYVGGKWPDFTAEVARFPEAAVYSIAVNSSENADFLDIENGDATIAVAPAWVQRQLASGVTKPGLYTSLANVSALLTALLQVGIRRSAVRLWTAHYTLINHICSPACGYGMTTTADGTQWSDKAYGGADDESTIAPSFSNTPPPPAPPIPITFSGGKMQTQISVAILNGKGWCPSPVPAANVVNVIFEDENPEVVGHYDSLPTFTGIATSAGPNSPNGALVFTGPVNGTFGAVLWYETPVASAE